ncbi:MAG: hypothetical protein F6K04_19845 [Leptolyngbya sp. SIO4C5]|nr:hypothetical protein [Leptolyngbya sp. SIO4C5]
MKVFSRPLGFSVLASCLIIGLGSAPAEAQTGNASDVTGNIITTSDIAGGAFQPLPSTPVRGTPVAAAIDAALDESIARLAAGTLAPPANGLASGVTATDYRSAQTSLYSQLVSPGGNAAALQNSLIAQGAPAGPTQQLMTRLVSFLSGSPAAASLGATVQAYNAVVGAAGADFLTNIPAEFQVIQALLAEANDAALSAANTAQ